MAAAATPAPLQRGAQSGLAGRKPRAIVVLRRWGANVLLPRRKAPCRAEDLHMETRET
jgi:hypothetical protein